MNVRKDSDEGRGFKTMAANGAGADSSAAETANARDEADRAWLAVYEPVEQSIVEARERRMANRVRRKKERAKAQRRARGDLLEATEGFSAVWEREDWTLDKMIAWADGDVWTLTCLARALRLMATRRIDRLRHSDRRATYYKSESVRRHALAKGRRKTGKRTTTNSCPTREQILDGWLHRSDSHEATVRFGSLVMDLECYLDNSLIRDESGAIVGRRGGVKRWLQENIPALYLRYTTVMRYKAAAQKLRQIAELGDPVPAASIVDVVDGHGVGSCVTLRERSSIAHARTIWQEVVKGIGNTPTALMTRIDALLSPFLPMEEGGMLAEWKRRYVEGIVARTKSGGGRPARYRRLSDADSGSRHRIA